MHVDKTKSYKADGLWVWKLFLRGWLIALCFATIVCIAWDYIMARKVFGASDGVALPFGQEGTHNFHDDLWILIPLCLSISWSLIAVIYFFICKRAIHSGFIVAFDLMICAGMTVGAAQVVINGGYDRNQYLDDAYLEPGTCSSSGYCMKGETDTVVQVELAAGVLGTVAAIVECALVLVTLRQARKTWKASRNQARMEISPENQKTRPIAHEDPQSPPELATPSSLPSYYATAQYQYPLLQQNAALAEYSAKSGHRFASSPPGLKSQGQLYGLEHPAFRHELNHFDGKRSSYVAELGATEEVRPDRITTRADRWSNGEGPDRLPERNKDHDVDSPISPI